MKTVATSIIGVNTGLYEAFLKAASIDRATNTRPGLRSPPTNGGPGSGRLRKLPTVNKELFTNTGPGHLTKAHKYCSSTNKEESWKRGTDLWGQMYSDAALIDDPKL